MHVDSNINAATLNMLLITTNKNKATTMLSIKIATRASPICMFNYEPVQQVDCEQCFCFKHHKAVCCYCFLCNRTFHVDIHVDYNGVALHV